jgi:hypothetical protein
MAQKRFSSLVLLLCATLACADAGTAPSDSYRPPLLANVPPEPDCKAGFCGGTSDPNPEAPGVFLGFAVTDETCFDSSQTDHDQDDVSTFCEENLAAAFAPELKYYQYDDVRREPYWVARRSGANSVVIGYLLSYYQDGGGQSYLCTIPFPHYACLPHIGDSEAIFLEVYYNISTEHWVLNAARYSQHGNYPVYGRDMGDSYPMALEYPEHPGSYPRAWVAQGKHANYPTRGACMSGGTLGTDTCQEVNSSARVAAGGYLNLGSREVHTVWQDCLASQSSAHPYYGSGRQECYWTNREFRGWYPDSVSGGQSTAYEEILLEHGF